MLIRFAVENFMSFKDRQIFSMIAAKHTRHMEHVASICRKRILKGSFLFGANASGKSNFIKAVYYAKQIIFYGLDKADVDRKYFRIESGYAQKPGMFQFDIFAGDIVFSQNGYNPSVERLSRQSVYILLVEFFFYYGHFVCLDF